MGKKIYCDGCDNIIDLTKDDSKDLSAKCWKCGYLNPIIMMGPKVKDEDN